MTIQPWHKIATLRKEVRSFSYESLSPSSGRAPKPASEKENRLLNTLLLTLPR